MKRSAVLCLALCLVFQVSSAVAVTQYNLTRLGAFGAYPTSGSTASSYAYAVNDLGHVAGKANASGQSSKAFIWKDNVMTGLGTLASGAGSSYAYGINDTDVVVGYSDYSAPFPEPSGPMAFRWNPLTGTMTGLGWLDGWLCDRSVAYGVNNSGVITGISQVYTGNLCGDTNVHSYAFLYTGTGPMSYLPNLDHGTNISSFPQAINQNGTIAGWNSSAVSSTQNGSFVVTSGGSPMWLGDLGAPSGGGHISYAYGINDTMDVVGESTSPRTNNYEAFIWTSSGGMVALGDLSGGLFDSRAYGINNSRQVVGTGNSASGQQAFLWDSVNGMVSLNSLILAASGWQLLEARDINNNGQIVGWGINPSGGTEAYLLTPAPVAPLIGFSPASLSFTGGAGGANPASQSLSISNIQLGTLDWVVSPSANWLSLAPTSGQQSGTVTVSVNIAGLAVGTYATNVQITGNATNSPQSVPVTLTILNAPLIGVTPASLSWTIVEGSTSSTKQQLRVTNSGGGTMSYATSADRPWILAPSSGVLSSGAYTDVDVSVNPTDLSPGAYYVGNVVITAPGATNTPQNAPVSLTILPAITITFPNGNEVFRPGENTVITWTVNPPEQTVAKTETFYTIDGGSTWKLIKSQTGMKSSCAWRVPSVKTTTDRCKVWTKFKNAAGKVIAADESDNTFQIWK